MARDRPNGLALVRTRARREHDSPRRRTNPNGFLAKRGVFARFSPPRHTGCGARVGPSSAESTRAGTLGPYRGRARVAVGQGVVGRLAVVPGIVFSRDFGP